MATRGRRYNVAMNKVASLEREVKALSPAELAAFRDWFANYDADEWDQRIEADVKAGKLDRLAADAISAHERGETKGI